MASSSGHVGSHNIFTSIKCGLDGIEFIDAGFGYNNPCGVLLKEARQQFPNA